MKLMMLLHLLNQSKAAAFGRLCVETAVVKKFCCLSVAAAFGRLCVETAKWHRYDDRNIAAAFGRLCVETWRKSITTVNAILAAAFGRLCVETDLLTVV